MKQSQPNYHSPKICLSSGRKLVLILLVGQSLALWLKRLSVGQSRASSECYKTKNLHHCCLSVIVCVNELSVLTSRGFYRLLAVQVSTYPGIVALHCPILKTSPLNPLHSAGRVEITVTNNWMQHFLSDLNKIVLGGKVTCAIIVMRARSE